MQAIALPALAGIGTAAAGGSTASIIGSLGMGLLNAASSTLQQQDSGAEEEATQLANLALEESRLEADRVLAESEKQAEQLRKDRARERAQRNVSVGASGVLLQGSPLQVLEGQAYLDEQDAQELLQTGLTNSESILLRGGWTADSYNTKAKRIRDANKNSLLKNTTSTLNSIANNYSMF